MPATPAVAHPVRPTRHYQPLALIYAAPLLLTEECFPEPDGSVLGMRAIRVTLTLQETTGYRHDGIND